MTRHSLLTEIIRLQYLKGVPVSVLNLPIEVKTELKGRSLEQTPGLNFQHLVNKLSEPQGFAGSTGGN